LRSTAPHAGAEHAAIEEAKLQEMLDYYEICKAINRYRRAPDA
jgi:hypothetical protein